MIGWLFVLSTTIHWKRAPHVFTEQPEFCKEQALFGGSRVSSIPENGTSNGEAHLLQHVCNDVHFNALQAGVLVAVRVAIPVVPIVTVVPTIHCTGFDGQLEGIVPALNVGSLLLNFQV